MEEKTDKLTREEFALMNKHALWSHIKTLEKRIDCLRLDKDNILYANECKIQLIELLQDENQRLLQELNRKDKLIRLLTDKLINDAKTTITTKC